jgi:hypothetical protein
MMHMRISFFQNLPTICMVSLLVPLPSVAAQEAPKVEAFDRDFILVQEVTSAEQAALAEVEDRVRQDRTKAPTVVTTALRTEVPKPIPYSCEVVRAAILGLDGHADRIEIARIVFAAVKVRPEEALSIVGVAVEDLPERYHRDIVGAAVAAVPDPYVCVSRSSLRSPPCSRRPDLITYEPEQAGPCKELTLAEAVLQQALLSGTNQDETALSATINAVLQSALNPQTGPANSLGSLDPEQGNSFAWDTLITADPPTATRPPTPVVQPIIAPPPIPRPVPTPVVQPRITPPPTPRPVSP